MPCLKLKKLYEWPEIRRLFQSANTGNHVSKTECEDVTLAGQSSTCGKREACPILKQLVLVVPESAKGCASSAALKDAQPGSSVSNWRSTMAWSDFKVETTCRA